MCRAFSVPMPALESHLLDQYHPSRSRHSCLGTNPVCNRHRQFPQRRTDRLFQPPSRRGRRRSQTLPETQQSRPPTFGVCSVSRRFEVKGVGSWARIRAKRPPTWPLLMELHVRPVPFLSMAAGSMFNDMSLVHVTPAPVKIITHKITLTRQKLGRFAPFCWARETHLCRTCTPGAAPNRL